MVKSQGRSKTTRTGGLRRPKRKKRKHEIGGHPSNTQVGDGTKVKAVRTRGGGEKEKALVVSEVSVQKPDGTSETTDIENVVENPADPHYVRRNIINQGAVIETPLGRCRVTNRPSQEGSVNAVLLNE